MSIKIMSLVWDTGPSDKSEILVLLALADFCNDDGECWPSVAGIARKARMTERGVQKIIARLVDVGWVSINQNSGRRGCNLYTIKTPEPRSPRTTFTPNAKTPPPNPVPKTPEPRSPEPSITIIKPSVSDTTRDVFDVLCKWASPDAVSSFIAYRRKQKGKALSLTAAKRLSGHLEKIFQEGGDTDDALGMAEEKGWQSVEPSWYFKAKEQQNGNASSNRGGSRASGTGNAMVDAFAAVAAARIARNAGY
jgi:hypothetical protein